MNKALPKFDSDVFDRKVDYQIISKWWKDQNWPIVPLENLPTYGLMVWLDEVPLAAGFIYQTDSSMALLEWIVSNPEVAHELRGQALDILLDDLCFMAKKLGFKQLFTMAKNERLIEREKSHGFLKTDDQMIHLIKEL